MSRTPWIWLDQFPDHSLMVINPDTPKDRCDYLLAHSDYNLLVTDHDIQQRDSADHGNERLFWYTSGTTGDSKFCSFSQDQLDSMTARVAKIYDLSANDRLVNVMPLWHAHGQAWYWVARHVGFEIHHLPVANIRSLTQFEPTFVSAIPHVIKILMDLSLSHLRFLRSASAALPSDLYTALQQRFQVPVIEAFGMTETLSQCFTNPLHGRQKIGTVGLPDGVEARIVDGRLEVRGSTLCVEGWFDTGDLAAVDHDGYYKILGRSVDRINVKGYKFDPLSLEQKLTAVLPDLGQCVIFGRELISCIYTGSISPDSVRQGLKSIHPLCQFDQIMPMDHIPVGSSGKISRTWLQQTLGTR